MASDPGRSAAEDTIVVDAYGYEARDEEWPVAELYRVDAEDEARGAGDRTVVLAAPTEPGPPRRRLLGLEVALVTVALAVGAMLLAAVLLARRDDGGPRPSAGVTSFARAPSKQTTTAPATPGNELPDLTGMAVADARGVLKGLGLRPVIRIAPSARPRGTVLRQRPSEGTRAARSTAVSLVVSGGSAPETQAKTTVPSVVAPSVVVPSVVGRSAADAAAAIREAGFGVAIRLVPSSERPGIVVRQAPAGAAAAKRGSTVRLLVSKTRRIPVQIEVPDLVGLDATDARQRLAGLGLTVAVVRLPSPQPVGTVLRQSPRAGTRLSEKARVSLTVSSGPREVVVVDVTGLDEESARAELEAAGFDVTVTYEPTSDPAEDGVVLRQTPTGGTSAAFGDEVTIVVAQLG
ncbi:MAG: PASTA domain-containing protein [Verrucomicrobiota bacterium]